MQRPDQKRLFTCVLPVDTPLGALDLSRLRVIFRDLFDQADQRLQRTGFDHDDIEIRRFLLCQRPDGVSIRISADSLANQEMLIAHLRAELADTAASPASGTNHETTSIGGVVVQAEIDVVRDEWNWYCDRRPPSAGNP